MWLPIEAPDGYVAELVQCETKWVWTLWTKREDSELWVYCDDFKSKPVGLEAMAELAERALLDPVHGAVSLCKKVTPWKERDWEFEKP